MDYTGDSIIREALPYTMMPVERLLANYNFLNEIKSKKLLPAGKIAEFGVWKGGMALLLARTFGPNREYEFFDSFEGMPQPGEKDGEDARFWYQNKTHPRYFNNCKTSSQEVRELFDERLLEYESVKLNIGLFRDTVNFERDARFALVHLDADWFDSTYFILEHVWARLSNGAIIIIDDYYDWEGCRMAVHEFLARTKAREMITSIGESGGVFLKKLPDWTVNDSPHLL